MDREELGKKFAKIVEKADCDVCRSLKLDNLSLEELRIVLACEEDSDGAPEELIEEILSGKSYPTAKEIMDELVNTFGY